MHRPSPAAATVAPATRFLSALALLVTIAPVALARVDAAKSIERARALLARDDPRAAVDALEQALVEAPASSPARARIVLELKAAYEQAARQAEAAGQPRVAETYRENLSILDRKPGPMPAVAVPAPLAPMPPAQKKPDDKPKDEPREFADLNAPGVSTPQPPAPMPLPRPKADPKVRRVSEPEAPEPQDSTPAQEPAPAAAPAQAPAPSEPQADDPAARIKAADAAFRARRYDEAGRLYAALAKDNALPKERRNHWAYCRCADVVRRINAGPQTKGEWGAIYNEINQIRTLSPSMWYGEYLRNLAAERAAASGTKLGHGAGKNSQPDAGVRRKAAGPGSQPVVVRGSSPEEVPGQITPMGADEGQARPLLAANGPGDAPPAPDDERPGQDLKLTREAAVGNWQVLSTPNFRILHADPALAERVARNAEAARDAQMNRWIGAPASRAAWSPKCDIYLYPTAALFSQMTGQPQDSPGFSTMGLNGGKIIARRVNLRADHPNLVHAVLPHEVTHVVLADLFANQQVPRWADEGMAVLAEPGSEQQLRANDLQKPLASGRVFRVQDLMTSDYPDGKYWGLYYAQSVSLTRFLVEQGTPAQFIRFLQGSQRTGVEPQLRQVYKIDGFADLQRRWLAYAREKESTPGQADTSTASAETNDTVRRE